MASKCRQPLVDLFEIFDLSKRGEVLAGLYLCEIDMGPDERIRREDVQDAVKELLGDAPSYPTVREHLDALEERGLIVAFDDTKPYSYRLTAEGCDRLEHCMEQCLEVMHKARPCIEA